METGKILQTGQIENQSFFYDIKKREPFKITMEDYLKRLNETICSGLLYGSDVYVIDDNNRVVITDLFYYLTCDDRFSGNIEKGIMLVGAIGSGKTLLLNSFLKILESFIYPNTIKRFHSKDIIKIINEEESNVLQSILYIDDVGKEPSYYKEYGNTIRPFEDFIRQRYQKNILTFGTSNYKLEDMPYIDHTKDRMKQMFNFIVLPGKSRR